MSGKQELSETVVHKTATVTYQFSDSGSMTVVVQKQMAQHEASDGNKYNGYKVLSGKFEITKPGGAQEKFTIIESQYQVLWATTSDGSGGSSLDGLDSYGLNLAPTLGQIYYQRAKGEPPFAFSDGLSWQTDLNLLGTTGWPIS